MVTGWIVTEGMAGTENQCRGVMDALDLTPDIRRIALRQPWRMLCPYLPFEQSWSFVPALQGPWPDLLITAGRKAIAAARYIKKCNPKTYTVHLQDPHYPASFFDLVAVPHHDTLRGDHVVVTDAAPNRMTAQGLANAPRRYTSDKPMVGVLIGGNSKTHRLSDAVMEKFSRQLADLARDYKLLVTISRRTGAAQTRQLLVSLQGTDAAIWDGTGENPYFSILAQAACFIVTNDSVSMISDAATTGKPVHLVALEGASPKFARFYDHMAGLGITRPFAGQVEHWTYTPLRDAQKIADFIRKASGLFD